MPAATVAFFDLDRTLVAENTAQLFARWEHAAGRISRLQVARTMVWLVGYHFSVIDMEAAYAKALAHYVGTPAEVLAARTREWFDAEVAQRLLPEARAALDRHRAQGHRLVILSNTSNFQAEVAAERWGFDAWLANQIGADARGLLDGTVEAPLCHGEGKVVRARRWLAEHGGSLDDAWFYSDSLSDVPMLAAVGNPQVMNPDPRLAREAKRRGWPVSRWTGAPGGTSPGSAPARS